MEQQLIHRPVSTLEAVERDFCSIDEPLTIITSDVPETPRDNIAAAVLDGVLTYFESAANRAKYEAWLAARKQRKALSGIGQCK